MGYQGESGKKFPAASKVLSAIGDTISCDAPYSTIGFRAKFFFDAPLLVLSLLIAIGHFYLKERKGGDSLRYRRKHSATRVLLHLSRNRGGGYFGQVTKRKLPENPSSKEFRTATGPQPPRVI